MAVSLQAGGALSHHDQPAFELGGRHGPSSVGKGGAVRKRATSVSRRRQRLHPASLGQCGLRTALERGWVCPGRPVATLIGATRPRRSHTLHAAYLSTSRRCAGPVRAPQPSPPAGAPARWGSQARCKRWWSLDATTARELTREHSDCEADHTRCTPRTARLHADAPGRHGRPSRRHRLCRPRAGVLRNGASVGGASMRPHGS